MCWTFFSRSQVLSDPPSFETEAYFRLRGSLELKCLLDSTDGKFVVIPVRNPVYLREVARTKASKGKLFFFKMENDPFVYFAALTALNGCDDDQKTKFCEAFIVPF